MHILVLTLMKEGGKGRDGEREEERGRRGGGERGGGEGGREVREGEGGGRVSIDR